MNHQLLDASIAFAVSLLVFLLGRGVTLRLLSRKIPERQRFARVFLHTIRFPSILWCLAGAIATTLRSATPSPGVLHWANLGIGTFLIISMSLVFAAMFVRMVSVYGERNGMHFAVAGLSRTLIYVFVFAIGLMMLLRMFNVEITPILTALGVGGLAVALALQDTLANLFAGIHVLIEEPLLVGDFVKLATGEEGQVQDIGWRTTRILTAGNSITVIPNTKITSGNLTNYSMPDKRMSADVLIYAAHHADHHRIAEIALDIASGTENVLKEPAPCVWFDPGVLPTHLQMKLVVFVPSNAERGPVLSTIRSQIYERFLKEEIPFPVVRV